MRRRITRPFRFFLERWIQKGVPGQLLLMASAIVAVAVLGGVVAFAATPRFERLPEAVWWAFLRLTDPGYLGDDEGTLLRAISTVVTVAGYVLFMGSLIAILTQGLARTIAQLESGVTPVAMTDHVVLLGWTNRTPEVVRKLLSARGRLRRFLEAHDARRLRIVVLSDEAGSARRLELREYLGERWRRGQVLLRAGSSLHPEHLARLDLRRASVVVVPGADFELGGAERTDTRVIKTLMTLESLLRACPPDQRPHVVAEIFDPRKARIARHTIEHGLEVVASNRIVSRLVSQSVRHRGLAQVLFGLFAHREGSSLYLRAAPELVGHSPRALTPAFRDAVVLGLLRTDEHGHPSVTLDPATEETLRPEDLVVFLAESWDQCVPSAAPAPLPPPRPAAADPPPARSGGRERAQSILVLGWSHKLSALVTELDQAATGRYDLTVVSLVEIAEREEWLARVAYDAERIRVAHVDGDYSIEADLEEVEPWAFDHVLLLASDWLDSSEAADARTLLGYALLRALLKGREHAPEILVELLDPENEPLFQDSRDVVLVTPRVLSHVLAHVTLRPELNAVLEALFGAGGADIDVRRAAALGLADRTVTFPEIQRAAFAQGLVALGVLGAATGIELNPARDRHWQLGARDRVVVMATDDGEED